MIRVHHVGYLVKHLEKAGEAFRALGFVPQGEAVYDDCRDVDIQFLDKDGYTVELVSPRSERSVVAGLIKTYRNAPYHLCYISDDFAKDLSALEAAGFRTFDSPMPAPALGGRRVCFLMNARIGMIELLENDENKGGTT